MGSTGERRDTATSPAGRRRNRRGPARSVRRGRRPAGRRQAAADRGHARRRLRAAFAAIKHRHPGTGADLGPRLWCGRCGALEPNELLIAINHELSWCAGCYTGLRPGVLASPFAHLSEAQRADRWDRQFVADCAGCAHPWGLHGWDIGGGSHDTHAGCQAVLRSRCPCIGYHPSATTGPAPTLTVGDHPGRQAGRNPYPAGEST